MSILLIVVRLLKKCYNFSVRKYYIKEKKSLTPIFLFVIINYNKSKFYKINLNGEIIF